MCRSLLFPLLFPLLGTGQGGVPAARAIRPMLEGLRSFLDHADNQAMAREIDEIFIAAFTEPDLERVRHAMRDYFR